jgi:hypothetical protein
MHLMSPSVPIRVGVSRLDFAPGLLAPLELRFAFD